MVYREKELIELGMNGHMAKVYSGLLKQKPQSVAQIARQTGLHRPSVYKALALLKKEKLIQVVIVGKRKQYSLSGFEQLARWIKKKKVLFEKASGFLLSKFSQEYFPQYIKKYKGKKGIQEILTDIVVSTEKGGIYYALHVEGNKTNKNDYVPKDFRAARDKKKLKRLVLATREVGNAFGLSLERDIKFVPDGSDLLDFPYVQFIYGDKVAVIDIKTEEGLVLQNKTYAILAESIFKSFYNIID